MLKKLTIRNFKAIQDMTIEFTPMTVLIGENGCGKSTILQAIDFLRSAASRDIPEYIKEKEWKFNELKSMFNGGNEKPLEFVSTWNFPAKDGHETIILEWTLLIDFDKGYTIKEKLIKYPEEKTVLSYHNNGQDDIPAPLGQLNIQSSALKYVAGTSINTEEIDKLFSFLSDTTNFEVLSPDKIRKGNKLPYTWNIGAGGESLAYYIDKMNDNEKQKLNKTVSDILGSCVEIHTVDQGNKVNLSVAFKSDKNKITVDSLHISEGILRIIAFAAISMEKAVYLSATGDGKVIATNSGTPIITNTDILKNGIVLLDEIENGINPYKTEIIIGILRDIAEKHERQIIITTHSPVMLNEFQHKEIVFLWKDKNGCVRSKKFFDTEEMCKPLDFLNPGEIWENYGRDAILNKLGIPSKEQ